jgi:hypothetical protein
MVKGLALFGSLGFKKLIFRSWEGLQTSRFLFQFVEFRHPVFKNSLAYHTQLKPAFASEKTHYPLELEINYIDCHLVFRNWSPNTPSF